MQQASVFFNHICLLSFCWFWIAAWQLSFIIVWLQMTQSGLCCGCIRPFLEPGSQCVQLTRQFIWKLTEGRSHATSFQRNDTELAKRARGIKKKVAINKFPVVNTVILVEDSDSSRHSLGVLTSTGEMQCVVTVVDVVVIDWKPPSKSLLSLHGSRWFPIFRLRWKLNNIKI